MNCALAYGSSVYSADSGGVVKGFKWNLQSIKFPADLQSINAVSTEYCPE